MGRVAKVVWVLALVALLPVPPVPPALAREPGAPWVHVTVAFVGLGHDGTATRDVEFSAEELRDLLIVVRWQHLAGAHTQRLELFSPDGSLYQRLSADVAVGEERPGRPPQAPARGKSAARAKVRRPIEVETRLPVGGTWITEHALLGPWRVDVYLDREDMPVTSEVFVLHP